MLHHLFRRRIVVRALEMTFQTIFKLVWCLQEHPATLLMRSSEVLINAHLSNRERVCRIASTVFCNILDVVSDIL